MRPRLNAVALSLAAAVVVSVGVVSAALSQDRAKAPAPGGPAAGGAGDEAAAMQKAMDAMNPGPMHKHLEPFVGKWTTTMKMWMGGPGAEPTVCGGTAEVKWVLGGRYVQDTHRMKMKMPGPDGQLADFDMEGMGLTGYDNFKKMYVFTWADNMSTQLITGLGTYHADTKTLTSYGAMDEPMIETFGRTVKYVSRIVDADTRVFEIVDLHAGDDHKVLEITYKRSK